MEPEFTAMIEAPFAETPSLVVETPSPTAKRPNAPPPAPSLQRKETMAEDTYNELEPCCYMEQPFLVHETGPSFTQIFMAVAFAFAAGTLTGSLISNPVILD
jgi:hypothetical protein